MEQAEIVKLINAGILAPSADNLQPWKFKITKNQVDVFIDPDRVKNFCDEGLFAPYLSAGAVIENMRVAARESGHFLSASYFPVVNNRHHIVSLWITSTDTGNNPHFSALKERSTNRKLYLMKKIDTQVYEKFEHLIEQEKDCKLIWVKKNDSKYGRLSRILGEADQLRFENQRLHREFFETIRLTEQTRLQTKDGLDFRTLEAGPGSNLLFKLISSWNRLDFLNRLGMSHLFNLYTWLQMQSSQACGLIVSKNHTPIHYVLGGEIMQRMWHEATLEHLAIQPMEALPIFLIQLKENGCPDLNLAQKVKLKKMKEDFYSIFNIQENNGLILLFRIGYAKEPKFRSLRRDVESFLMK